MLCVESQHFVWLFDRRNEMNILYGFIKKLMGRKSIKVAKEYLDKVSPVYIRDCVNAFGGRDSYNVIVVCRPKSQDGGFAYYVTTKQDFAVAAEVAKKHSKEHKKGHPEEDFLIVVIQNAKIVGVY